MSKQNTGSEVDLAIAPTTRIVILGEVLRFLKAQEHGATVPQIYDAAPSLRAVNADAVAGHAMAQRIVDEGVEYGFLDVHKHGEGPAHYLVP